MHGDQFDRSGDEIYLRGRKVAQIEPDMWATLRESVEDLIDAATLWPDTSEIEKALADAKKERDTKSEECKELETKLEKAEDTFFETRESLDQAEDEILKLEDEVKTLRILLGFKPLTEAEEATRQKAIEAGKLIVPAKSSRKRR